MRFWSITTLLFFWNNKTLSSAMSTSLPNGDASAAANSVTQTIDFLTLARGLKTTKRTGWVRQEANPQIESVADHSWRISVMAMVASAASQEGEEKVDAGKCIRMALVHDLAESAVGDITPYCGVSDEEKHRRELEAMKDMTKRLEGIGGGVFSTGSSTLADEVFSLWKEYEEGTTQEAKLVKDLDKLEMILQALEYESDGKNGKSLDGFFDSTRNKWRTELGKAWGKEIEARRNQVKSKVEE